MELTFFFVYFMATWHFFRKSTLSTKRYNTFVLNPNTVILICVKAFITGTKKLSVFHVVIISMGLFVKSLTAWYLSPLIWIPFLTIFCTTNCDRIPWVWNSVGHKCILFFLPLSGQLSSVRPCWWDRQGNAHLGNTSERPSQLLF